MLSAVLLVLAAEGAIPVAAEAAVVEPNPKAMSQAEIKAFNAKLARSHPYFIRCVRREEVGSLVKRNLSCRTNAQWKRADDAGNQSARDSVEAMQSKATNTSG